MAHIMFLWVSAALELHIEFVSLVTTPVTIYVHLMPWLWWSQAINNWYWSRMFLPQGFCSCCLFYLSAHSPRPSPIWLLFWLSDLFSNALSPVRVALTTSWPCQPVLFSLEYLYILSAFPTRLELREKVYHVHLSISRTQNSTWLRAGPP